MVHAPHTARAVPLHANSHPNPNPRCSRFMHFIKTHQPDSWGNFLEDICKTPDAKELVTSLGEDTLDPVEIALLVVGAGLTHKQFGYLANRGALSGTKARSRYVLARGMKELEKQIPKMYYLTRGYPGCCFNPKEYVRMLLHNIVDELNLAPGEKIILAWKEDGTPEGKFKKYPMLATCLNLPQQADCQSIKNCHVLAIARCSESAEAERKHFGQFHALLVGLDSFEGHPLVHVQVGDGSDCTKKCGLMGTAATYPCFRCIAMRNKSADHMAMPSWRFPECQACVVQERHYLRPECKAQGKCVCAHEDCAKHLAEKIEAKFAPASLLTDKAPTVTLTLRLISLNF
jgi:hypothetical protein